jgi:hypothetical protein
LIGYCFAVAVALGGLDMRARGGRVLLAFFVSGKADRRGCKIAAASADRRHQRLRCRVLGFLGEAGETLAGGELEVRLAR